MYNRSIKPNKIKPNTHIIGQNVFYYKAIDSTNSLAKRTDCKDGSLFVTECQTNGRGRMGREWVSEKKCGIYMTFVLKPQSLIENINQIPLVTGLAVCRTLIELYNLQFQIKWPNDIVIEGKKVCGILAEGIREGNKFKIVDGIGINVNNSYFPKHLQNKATSLYILTGKKSDRVNIINKFAEIFEYYYNDFLINGIENILEEYRALCTTLDKEIMIIKDNDKIKATAIGITKEGELTIKKEDGTILNINSGEVSVRGIYGY